MGGMHVLNHTPFVSGVPRMHVKIHSILFNRSSSTSSIIIICFYCVVRNMAGRRVAQAAVLGKIDSQPTLEEAMEGREDTVDAIPCAKYQV
jgi:hypothetical protein